MKRFSFTPFEHKESLEIMKTYRISGFFSAERGKRLYSIYKCGFVLIKNILRAVSHFFGIQTFRNVCHRCWECQ